MYLCVLCAPTCVCLCYLYVPVCVCLCVRDCCVLCVHSYFTYDATIIGSCMFLAFNADSLFVCMGGYGNGACVRWRARQGWTDGWSLFSSYTFFSSLRCFYPFPIVLQEFTAVCVVETILTIYLFFLISKRRKSKTVRSLQDTLYTLCILHIYDDEHCYFGIYVHVYEKLRCS